MPPLSWRVARAVSPLLLLLLLGCVVGRPASPHGQFRTFAPFDTCPACTVPFQTRDFLFHFAAPQATLSGHAHAVLGIPGANGAAHVVCGRATLAVDGQPVVDYTIEAAGPGPSLSRAFYETHPDRTGTEARNDTRNTRNIHTYTYTLGF